MSRRTFSRQFRATTGMALGPWRTAAPGACAAIAGKYRCATESIAVQCGLGSAQNLRLQFRKVLGLTPQQWRRQFRGGVAIKTIADEAMFAGPTGNCSYDQGASLLLGANKRRNPLAVVT